MTSRAAVLVRADRVHTFADDVAPDGDTVLVRDGIVAAIGANAELAAAAPGARVIDLRGTVLTPGLADSHVHLTEWALARHAVDLREATSPEHAARLVAGVPPAGAVLRGRGWNAHRWHGAAPHRTLLDAVAPADLPVVLQSHDMHSIWVNGAALRAAGITAETADPAGGYIERDERGEPTGVLFDAACQLVTAALPPPDRQALRAALADAQRALHAAGITACHSLPGVHLRRPDPLDLLQEMNAASELRLRVLQHIALDDLAEAERAGLRSGAGDDWLHIGGIKLFLDGSLGSRTAWLLEPYEDSASRGIRVMEPAEFRYAVARADAAGFAVTVHAIGDAAVALAADVLNDPACRHGGIPQRIEHVQCCAAATLPRLRGTVCSVQPSHLLTDWRTVDALWGTRRAGGTYAFASLRRAGAILAFGSDAPVESIDPRIGLHAACNRQDLDRLPPGGWQAQERLDAVTAWHGYTRGPAYAAGWTDRLGQLTPGSYADLVAWDRDPLSAAAAAAPLELQCVATLVGGVVVHTS